MYYIKIIYTYIYYIDITQFYNDKAVILETLAHSENNIRLCAKINNNKKIPSLSLP